MIRDLQKADMWKRMSAFIFDKILLFTLAVGVAFLLSFMLDFNTYTDIYNAREQALETQYGVDLDITEEDYNKMSEAEKSAYNSAIDALSKDQDVLYAMTMLLQLTLILATFSVMLAYIALDFIVPIILGNGQTLGKKIFGIGVMRIDGVKISPLILFIRTVLGKYTIETMVPIFIIIGLMFGTTGPIGVFVIALIFITYIVLMIKTPTRSPIHDMLAHTVCVDMSSQLIFENEQQMLEYKQNLHKEMVDKAEY